MKFFKRFGKVTNILKSKRELQKEINIIGAWHLWDHTVSRYDVIEFTQVLVNFAKDPDLKLILNKGLDFLKQEVSEIEKLMIKYGIPLPNRPPLASTSINKVEVINDEYIFRRVFYGIQSFIPLHVLAMIHCATTPVLREEFKKFLINEIKLYDKFLVYGQLKGWVIEPPAYRV